MRTSSTEPRRVDAKRARRALLRLGALDKTEFAPSLREILRVDAAVLQVARVSLWMLRSDSFCNAIVSELGWEAGEGRYERGTRLLEYEAPRYFAALRSEELICATDAGTDARTDELSEEYLRPRRIRAVMDVPVWVRGVLVGVLCHEHVGAERSWTHDEQHFALAVGQVVATALEARDRRRAETAERRASFLANSSAALTETLDVTAIPSRLVALAVPLLGDWCTLDVLEDGALRTIACSHVDPGRKADLEALHQSYRPRLESSHPIAEALRSGQTVVAHEPDGLLARDAIVDDAHVAMLRRLGCRSSIAVPLCAHGRLLGVLVIVSGHHTYGPDEVALADELGRRAAIALDNARLYRESQEAIRVREEFLSVASHELYTPLTALDLAVERVRRCVARGDLEASLRSTELMVRQTHRLHRLIGGLLDVSRVQAGILALDRRRLDLVALARDVSEAYEHEVVAAGCALVFRGRSPVEVDADPQRLEQVVTNLLTNAIKFAAGKPIEVSVYEDRGCAVLAVSDHGIGIPPERAAKIFDRFEQAVSSRQYGGLGLGLYIARGIVVGHGGAIEVESRPGDGTTFRVTLPLAGK